VKVGGEKNDVYPTPDWLYGPLNRLLRFDLDAAADRHNTKCARFYDERANGLAQPWDTRSPWCNPPYGRKDSPTELWLWHGRRECERVLNRVTMLVPAKPDTQWYGRGVWGENRVVAAGRIEAGKISGRWYRLKESRFFVELLELEGRIQFAADQTGWFASSVVLFNAGPRPLLPELRRHA
jgi:phage N-6-adenine-methyltransferase